jgi:hypothetical protein
MFTTQIGPPNLGDDYLAMLEGYLRRNLQDDPALVAVLMQRTGVDDPGTLRNQDFSEFFRLAMPKIIAYIALEEDWFIDPDHGITIYEFERPSESGPYKMLHLVMDIKRQTPPKDGRPPGQRGENVGEAYRTVVRGIFENAQIAVSDVRAGIKRRHFGRFEGSQWLRPSWAGTRRRRPPETSPRARVACFFAA